jgi:hypothetical protein
MFERWSRLDASVPGLRSVSPASTEAGMLAARRRRRSSLEDVAEWAAYNESISWASLRPIQAV